MGCCLKERLVRGGGGGGGIKNIGMYLSLFILISVLEYFIFSIFVCLLSFCKVISLPTCLFIYVSI